MIVNQAAILALSKSFRTLFLEAYAQAKAEWEAVAMLVPSGTRDHEYGWLGGFPKMEEWVGDRVISALKAHKYTIVNKDWANGVEVKRSDIADDNYGVYNPTVQMIGHEAKMHPNELVFDLLKNGFSQLCFDGQPFFDTDHPVGESVASNNMAGSGTAWYLLCTDYPIKPIIFQMREQPNFTALDKLTDDTVFTRGKFKYGADYRGNSGYGLWQLAVGSKQTLNATNYESARVAMMSLMNDSGRPLNLKPTLLAVPPSLGGAGRALLLKEKDAYGADNPWYKSAELLETAWLI